MFTIISIFNDLPKIAKQNKQNVQNDKMFNIFIAGFWLFFKEAPFLL
jgi:hypothetical protein